MTNDNRTNQDEFEAWASSDPYAKFLHFKLFANGLLGTKTRTYLHIDTETAYRAWLASYAHPPSRNCMCKECSYSFETDCLGCVEEDYTNIHNMLTSGTGGFLNKEVYPEHSMLTAHVEEIGLTLNEVKDPAMHHDLFKIVDEAHVLNKKHKEESVTLVRTTIDAVFTAILESDCIALTDRQKIIEDLRLSIRTPLLIG